jgi:peptidyl-prolyl cis-trans isomerase C
MKTIRYVLLAAGLALSVPALAQVGPSIAKVNGVAVSQQHLDLLVKNLVAQGRQDTPEMREQLKQQMINRELMTQDAVKKGLDKQAETSARLVFARQDVLSSAYVQDIMKTHPVTDESMRKEYERIKAQLGAKEYKARHILVSKEDEAKDIIAQIKKGASFEKLAAERSIDTGTKGNGGDLDWGPPARYVKPFADALVKLKKGQMTDAPVQTQHGWHVIRVDDERATRIPGFEEAKPQLQQLLQNQALEKAVADLRAKAKIE